MPPINSFTVTRRNLPHWQNPGSTYFLTWRVTGVPILEPEDRTIALDAIRHWADLRWRLYAAVIMPDHAHALARPLPVDPARPTAGAVYDLSELIASVKKFSALRINRRRGRQGTLWQDERHDHI